ncbi:MAG: adenylate/guanylate cyclase domain-containing protein [Methylocystaceae bacterium]|nr:adenylate/guanylate cyclase domain-containing protein [Methylocystaceae bacterium]
MTETQEKQEQPFQLKGLFYSRIIPGLIISLLVLLVFAFFGSKTLVKSIYLSFAVNRAQAIELNIKKQAPDAWEELLATRHPDLFFQSPQGLKLHKVIDDIVVDTRTDKFKLYNKDRVMLFSHQTERIGSFENNPDLDPLFREGKSLVIAKEKEGLNELYVPLFNKDGSMRAIFELYEKRIFLDSILLESFLPTIIVPTILFLILFAYMLGIVRKAQIDIDLRATALMSVRKKLEQFVSFSTVQAATLFSESGEIEPQRIATTIYYSDVRSFTSLADTLPPTEVVNYLNTVMSIQIDIIKKHNGDIDKLIGDAVLAQFDGTDGEKRAVTAAVEIITALQKLDLARGIGIGIQAGDVLACAVGSKDRKDFTIIGDTVNLAARLCSAAQVWEIVVEERTLRHSGQRSDAFIGPEVIQVKGHEHPIEIFRWHGQEETSAS